MRPSSVAIAGGVILAVLPLDHHRAKALERDLDVTSQKIVLLDKSAPISI